jgi:hypothetical protein
MLQSDIAIELWTDLILVQFKLSWDSLFFLIVFIFRKSFLIVEYLYLTVYAQHPSSLIILTAVIVM